MVKIRRCAKSVVFVLVVALFIPPNVPASSDRSPQSRDGKNTSRVVDVTRYVDPFIGTGGHGHTFPGPGLPFGMLQLSPDTRLTGWDSCSGYHYSDSLIYGFSHTHLSGTGIPDYGDVLFMPMTGGHSFDAKGRNPNQRGYANTFKHENESATPGYYRVKFDDGLQVELTATKRAGFHRYRFPDHTDVGNVILDLTHRDRVLDSYLRIVDKQHIEGFRRSSSWAKNQVVYFVAEFSRPFQSVATTGDQSELRGTNVKAAFRFDLPDEILLKVGISAVSIEGARKNLSSELAHWDFERARSDAAEAWRRELNKIEISGGDESQLKTFYTALYHAELTPNLFMDVDGEYLGRDFKIHKAEGFDYYTVFSLWDTFRAAHPLYTIIDQKRTRDFINTFLAQYREGGRLPVWELAANETDTMIGYHAVSVIADAVAKGIDGFDRELAFEAMKHSAELKHFGLGPYIDRGYIELEDERESVSKTLEYAYDDWCIAVVARALGRTDDYNRYIRRAQSYKNVFDRETGFVRPRTNASWLTPFDPREVNFNFTEANSWQYSFFAPQDISGLIELMGGEASFARKLDQLFTTESKTTGREQADITGLIGQYAHGNEPSHHVAYLYNYARQPWKTQYRVRQIMDTFYKATPDGLIGNEDCGQMSAWYVLSAAGFYPVTPGSTIYAIGSPLFPEIRFNLENGKSFTVKANNVSKQNFYIQSAKLNGKPYRKSFIDHADVIAGGELVFEMGDKPNVTWAREAPVSKLTGQQLVPVPVVESSGKTFNGRTRVSFRSDKDVKLYYTMDGREPDQTTTRFQGPFLIDKTSTLKFRAYNKSGEASQIGVAHFLKLQNNWKLTLLSKYSAQYSGGGDQALIDGVRGTTNFSSGAWQGYQGQDLVAIVDLGELRRVSRLGAGFLQDVGSWIVMPSAVSFEVSTDGKNFVSVLSISNDVPVQNYQAMIKDFTGTIAPRNVRYVKIRAQNLGKLPDWHPGAGGDAWIFADEIIIE
jgi:predicted alpha-1,2-mannosidase